MKYTIALFLLVCFSAFAQVDLRNAEISNGVLGTGGGGGGGFSGFLEETFETNPGSDLTWNTAVSGGTWSFDTSTSGLSSMVGSECLRVVNPNGGNRNTTFSAQTHVYGKFRFQLSSLDSAITIGLGASGGPAPWKIVIGAANVTLYNGTVSSTGSALSSGTAYWIWLEWQKGNGVNTGISRVWIATSNAKPGSPTITPVTTGDDGADTVNFYTSAGGNDNWYLDQIQLSTESFE